MGQNGPVSSEALLRLRGEASDRAPVVSSRKRQLSL